MTQRTFYITAIQPPDPADDDKQQFTVHWWVDSGLNGIKTKAGWRGQVFKTHLQDFKDRVVKDGHRFVEGDHPRKENG